MPPKVISAGITDQYQTVETVGVWEGAIIGALSSSSLVGTRLGIVSGSFPPASTAKMMPPYGSWMNYGGPREVHSKHHLTHPSMVYKVLELSGSHYESHRADYDASGVVVGAVVDGSTLGRLTSTTKVFETSRWGVSDVGSMTQTDLPVYDPIHDIFIFGGMTGNILKFKYSGIIVPPSENYGERVHPEVFCKSLAELVCGGSANPAKVELIISMYRWFSTLPPHVVITLFEFIIRGRPELIDINGTIAHVDEVHVAAATVLLYMQSGEYRKVTYIGSSLYFIVLLTVMFESWIERPMFYAAMYLISQQCAAWKPQVSTIYRTISLTQNFCDGKTSGYDFDAETYYDPTPQAVALDAEFFGTENSDIIRMTNYYFGKEHSSRFDPFAVELIIETGLDPNLRFTNTPRRTNFGDRLPVYACISNDYMYMFTADYEIDFTTFDSTVKTFYLTRCVDQDLYEPGGRLAWFSTSQKYYWNALLADGNPDYASSGASDTEQERIYYNADPGWFASLIGAVSIHSYIDGQEYSAVASMIDPYETPMVTRGGVNNRDDIQENVREEIANIMMNAMRTRGLAIAHVPECMRNYFAPGDYLRLNGTGIDHLCAATGKITTYEGSSMKLAIEIPIVDANAGMEVSANEREGAGPSASEGAGPSERTSEGAGPSASEGEPDWLKIPIRGAFARKGYMEVLEAMYTRLNPLEQRRLYVHAKCYDSIIELPQRPNINKADASAYMFLCVMAHECPLALSRYSDKFVVRNGPLYWYIIENIFKPVMPKPSTWNVRKYGIVNAGLLIDEETGETITSIPVGRNEFAEGSRASIDSTGNIVMERPRLTLFPWQSLAIESLMKFQRQIEVIWLATGAGKTLIVLEYIRRCIALGIMTRYVLWSTASSAMTNICRQIESVGLSYEIYKRGANFTPGTIVLCKVQDLASIDRTYVSGISSDLTMVLDEFHTCLSGNTQTQRSDAAYSIAKWAYRTIGISGTVFKNRNGTADLTRFLKMCVNFSITPENFRVALGLMFAMKIPEKSAVRHIGVRVDDPTDYDARIAGVEPKKYWSEYFYRIFSGLAPSAPVEVEGIVSDNNAVCGRMIFDAYKSIKIDGVGVVMGVQNAEMTETVAHALQKLGIRIAIQGKPSSLDFDPSIFPDSRGPGLVLDAPDPDDTENQSYRLPQAVLVTINNEAMISGYNMNRYRRMFIPVISTSLANKNQFEGRIQRCTNNAPVIEYFSYYVDTTEKLYNEFEKARHLNSNVVAAPASAPVASPVASPVAEHEIITELRNAGTRGSELATAGNLSAALNVMFSMNIPPGQDLYQVYNEFVQYINGLLSPLSLSRNETEIVEDYLALLQNIIRATQNQ